MLLSRIRLGGLFGAAPNGRAQPNTVVGLGLFRFLCLCRGRGHSVKLWGTAAAGSSGKPNKAVNEKQWAMGADHWPKAIRKIGECQESTFIHCWRYLNKKFSRGFTICIFAFCIFVRIL